MATRTFPIWEGGNRTNTDTHRVVFCEMNSPLHTVTPVIREGVIQPRPYGQGDLRGTKSKLASLSASGCAKLKQRGASR